MFTSDHIVESGLSSGPCRVLYAQKAARALGSQLDSSPATYQLCYPKLYTYFLRASFVSSLKPHPNSHGLRTDVMLYTEPLVEFLAWNKHSTVIIMIVVMILWILGLPPPHSALTGLLVHLRNACNCHGTFFIPFLSIMLVKPKNPHFIW